MRITGFIFTLLLASSVAQAGPFQWSPTKGRNHWNEIKARCATLGNLNDVAICRINQHIAMDKLASLTTDFRGTRKEADILLHCASIHWGAEPDAVRFLGCFDQRRAAWKRLLDRR